VRRVSRSLGVLAAMALAAAGISSGAASAATGPTARTKAQWQADIRHVREPGTGCYRASYPALKWHSIRCVTAPVIPMAPGPLPRSARHARPAVVGGSSSDYSARVSGLISGATGTFQDVSPGVTEQGFANGGSTLTANAFTLQLNSQYFAGSPACSGSSNPSDCLAWQQFLYAYDGPTTSAIYMQFWLINYNASCPSGWHIPALFPSDCITNSKLAGVNTLIASQLATVQMSGDANAGGLDSVELSVGSGQATSVTNSDSTVDLASFWNTTEWGVFGDGNSDEAFFGAGTTLQAQTALTATSTAAPSCIQKTFTGETNNLSLTSTPALGSQSAPTMATRQTDGTAGTASCSVAAGPNVVTVRGPGTQTTRKGTAVSLPIHATDSASSQKLTYSATGLPAGLAINPVSGLISGTPTTLQSASVRVTATDTTGASGSVGFGWIIYLNK
jgi:hypothetical protein